MIVRHRSLQKVAQRFVGANKSIGQRIEEFHALGKSIAAKVTNGMTIAQAINEEGFEKSRFTAYKARQFAAVVKTDQELGQYVAAAKEGKFSWTHIQALIQVKSRTERRKFFQESVKARWSPARLRHAIKGQDVFVRESGKRQGPPFRTPETHSDLQASFVLLLRRPFHLLEHILSDKATLKFKLSRQDLTRLNQLKAAIIAMANGNG